MGSVYPGGRCGYRRRFVVAHMSEMVERVAKAIASKQPPLSDRVLSMHAEQALFEMARAAIEAMRVPTEAMIEEAWADARAEDAAAVWKAMIDEALK